MPLDITKPTDQVLVAELPLYIRENRVAINAFESGEAEYTVTTLVVAAGTTTLVVGTSLANIDMEIVLISGLGAVTLQNITGGRAGQIKIFVFQNSNISLLDGAKSDGKFYLNQLPALSTFSAIQDDALSLVNIGGDGSSNNGYWKEFDRQLSVK